VNEDLLAKDSAKYDSLWLVVSNNRHSRGAPPPQYCDFVYKLAKKKKKEHLRNLKTNIKEDGGYNFFVFLKKLMAKSTSFLRPKAALKLQLEVVSDGVSMTLGLI